MLGKGPLGGFRGLTFGGRGKSFSILIWESLQSGSPKRDTRPPLSKFASLIILCRAGLWDIATPVIFGGASSPVSFCLLTCRIRRTRESLGFQALWEGSGLYSLANRHRVPPPLLWGAPLTLLSGGQHRGTRGRSHRRRGLSSRGCQKASSQHRWLVWAQTSPWSIAMCLTGVSSFFKAGPGGGG